MSDQCPCGLPLHYESEERRALTEDSITQLGDDVQVTTTQGSWLVPRHYVSLHGLVDISGAALDLGFVRVYQMPSVEQPRTRSRQPMHTAAG